jgi:hypothetical protein
MSASEGYSRTVDPCAVALEDAVRIIERELHHHLDPVERIAVTLVLERFGESWAWHRRKLEPWG